MSGRVSKVHATPLVSLCKERKDFIKAAKYCRYDFVTSFVCYSESILELGNALNQYVEQELVDCCTFFEFPFCDTDSDLDSSLHCVDEEEEEESIQEVNDESRYDTCKHHHVNVTSPCMDRNNIKNLRKPRVIESTSHAPFDFSSNNSPHRSNYENTHHVHFSSEGFGHYENSPIMEHYGYSYENYGAKPFPMVVSPNNYLEVSQKHGTEKNNASAATVSPIPPAPKVSNWDLLYPFNMKYDVPYGHDQDEREIREREGIPDLEDESELSEKSSNGSVFCQSEMESEMRHGSGIGTSNVAGLNANEDDALSTKYEKELTVWREANEEKIKGNLKPKITVQESGSESMGNNSVTPPVSSCSMSLKEAVMDIKNEFKHLFDYGREFSSVIEEGKLPYHSVNSKLRVFASCVLGQVVPSLQTRLYPSYMSHQPAPKARKLSKAVMHKQNNQVHACTELVDLSTTLEKLYVWEKKLYGEVVVEERLRIAYDKQYNRLKKLDYKGSESDKIDDTLASIKLLQSEISVAVASISVISRKINQLRDDKLLPELYKLIEGLIRLWKFMSTSHNKQLQAINKAKSHVHIVDHGNKKKSSSKATLRLERVVLKWGLCFSNFINTQKALVKHLNDWLMRGILQKTEEIEDRIGPSLPDDLEAPPIFGVCNKWYHAIDKISENEVSTAISNFAISLHQFYEKLKEERALKVRVKYLVKDYSTSLDPFARKMTSRHRTVPHSSK